MTITAVLAATLGLGAGLGALLIIASTTSSPRQAPTMRRAPRRNGRATATRAGVTVITGVVAGAATGWIIGAVGAAAAAWFLPALIAPDRAHHTRMARTEAIASWTEQLRDVLAAATGLEQALLATAPLAPTAIRPHIQTLVTRVRSGHQLARALRACSRDLDDPTGDLVLAALALAADRPARSLTTLLGSLATTAREHAAMRMRVATGRARTRTSVRVIIATTGAFTAAIVLFNRPYLDDYNTGTGQFVLLAIGVLFATGFTWLTRMSRPAPPARFLAHDHADPPAARNGGPA